MQHNKFDMHFKIVNLLEIIVLGILDEFISWFKVDFTFGKVAKRFSTRNCAVEFVLFQKGFQIALRN